MPTPLPKLWAHSWPKAIAGWMELAGSLGAVVFNEMIEQSAPVRGAHRDRARVR